MTDLIHKSRNYQIIVLLRFNDLVQFISIKPLPEYLLVLFLDSFFQQLAIEHGRIVDGTTIRNFLCTSACYYTTRGNIQLDKEFNEECRGDGVGKEAGRVTGM